MPTVNLPTIEVRIGFVSAAGLFSENVLHFSTPTLSGAEGSAGALANSFGIAFSPTITTLTPALSKDVKITSCLFRYMGPPVPPSTQPDGPSVAFLLNAPGEIDSPMMTNGVAACAKYFTDDHRRIGHSYIPGVSEDSIADDAIQTPYQVLLEAWLANLFSGFVDGYGNAWVQTVLDKTTGIVRSVLGNGIRVILSAFRRRLYPNPYVF